MLHSLSPLWRPPVVTLSAAAGTGIDAFWAEIERFRQVMTAAGELEARRQRQAVDWMWALIDSGLRSRFRQHPQVRHSLETISRAVAGGAQTPAAAAYRLLGYLGGLEVPATLQSIEPRRRHRAGGPRIPQSTRLHGPGSKPSRIAEVPHVRCHPSA